MLDPARVQPGMVIPLGGPSPLVRLSGQFNSRSAMRPLLEGRETGSFLIYELVPDKVLRGRFIEATVALGALDGVPTCRIGETVFEATPGG